MVNFGSEQGNLGAAMSAQVQQNHDALMAAKAEYLRAANDARPLRRIHWVRIAAVFVPLVAIAAVLFTQI